MQSIFRFTNSVAKRNSFNVIHSLGSTKRTCEWENITNVRVRLPFQMPELITIGNALPDDFVFPHFHFNLFQVSVSTVIEQREREKAGDRDREEEWVRTTT